MIDTALYYNKNYIHQYYNNCRNHNLGFVKYDWAILNMNV